MGKKKQNFDENTDALDNTSTDALDNTNADALDNTGTDALDNTSKPEKKKREIVIEAIEAGGATMESLMVAADCKYESIMSIFSTLRLMGKCPVKDVPATMTAEDGSEFEVMTYRLVTPEEWEQIKAERSSKSAAKREPKKSPAEQLEALNKRIENLTKAEAAAKSRFDQRPELRILELRAQKADIELQIACLERDELQAKINA